MSDAVPFELVDAHVHLWDLTAHRWYPAMQEPAPDDGYESLGDVTRMARDYLLPQYRKDLGDRRLAGLVHVSAVSASRRQLEETTWVDDLLATAGIPAALVGAVEPQLGAETLAADVAAQAAASERFRGVRSLAGLDPASGLAQTLCALLRDGGWVLDVVARPSELAGYRRLLERFPDLPVVIEHAGWPDGVAPADVAAWREALAPLAELEHVSCKVSGLGMVAHTLAAAALRPFVETCLTTFGPERCLFGSNFPVDAMYGGYGELLAALEAVVGELPASQQAAFFAGNAARVYRLTTA